MKSVETLTLLFSLQSEFHQYLFPCICFHTLFCYHHSHYFLEFDIGFNFVKFPSFLLHTHSYCIACSTARVINRITSCFQDINIQYPDITVNQEDACSTCIEKVTVKKSYNLGPGILYLLTRCLNCVWPQAMRKVGKQMN